MFAPRAHDLTMAGAQHVEHNVISAGAAPMAFAEVDIKL
jgi:hypothetical protein